MNRPREMLKNATLQLDSLMGLMGSLADATRLRLLRLLEHHELGVVDLCDILQLPQSTTSRHLRVLFDQGWLRSRRQATTHKYRMMLDELDAPTRKLWLLAREQTDPWATAHQDELRLEQRLLHRQRDSEAFFAGAASDWDELRSELYGDAFTYEALLALLPADYVVADLGCGTGALSARLADHVASVYAVDNSPAMLKAARKRIGNRDNVQLRRGDLVNLPLDDESCDAALLLLVLTYLPDPQKALSEMARILKPGGRAVIVDLLPHDRDDFRRELGQVSMGFDERDLEALLRSAHLQQPRIRPLPPQRGVKGPALFLATATKT